MGPLVEFLVLELGESLRPIENSVKFVEENKNVIAKNLVVQPDTEPPPKIHMKIHMNTFAILLWKNGENSSEVKNFFFVFF